MSNRDDWATPVDIYDAICKHWNIYPTIDVCATVGNTKCPLFITPERNALVQGWKNVAFAQRVEPIFWMNPPYSQPLLTHFLMKATEETWLNASIVFLLPAWVDQHWYHVFIKHYEHEFWQGRIRHIPPPGVKPSSPRYGSIHGVMRLR